MSSHRWESHFFRIARNEVAYMSKDPSTKVGCVIAADRRVISTGFNGFPQWLPDNPEWLHDRETKYKLVVHAEMNALLGIERERLVGADLYVTHPPCVRCAVHIVQMRLRSVNWMRPGEKFLERWAEDLEAVERFLSESPILWKEWDWYTASSWEPLMVKPAEGESNA